MNEMIEDIAMLTTYLKKASPLEVYNQCIIQNKFGCNLVMTIAESDNLKMLLILLKYLGDHKSTQTHVNMIGE